MLIERAIQPKLTEMFQKFAVVFLTGPRQSGKTTVAKSCFPKLPYVNLENPSERQRVMEDPC